MGIDAQLEQIPPAPLPDGRELLVVIAPLQVIGPPLLDELVAPLTYRIFDTVKGFQPDSSLGPNSKTGQRGMLGTNPDAVEAWCFDAVTFEALLKRLAAFGQVVLLSGDVHYTASTLMSYWRKGQLQPARLAQFTSSGFKNVMPAYISAIDRSLGFAQQLVRAKLGVERVGWDHPRDDLVIMPEGMTRADLPPALQARLRDTPVLIPTWGWPDKNVAGQEPKLEKISHLNDTLAPDWVWRARPILDTRPDAQRPSSVRPLALNDAAIDAAVQGPDPLGAYVSVAARHQGAVEKLKNARQMLFRGNLGLVRFERRVGKLVAIHEAWTAFADPDNPDRSRRSRRRSWSTRRRSAPRTSRYRRATRQGDHRREDAAGMSFFRSLAREALDFFEFVGERPRQRSGAQELIRDLGGDPAAPAPVSPFPESRLASVRAYADGADTSAESALGVLKDIGVLVGAVAANYTAWRAGWRQARIAASVHSLLDLLASNYVRVRYPRMFLMHPLLRLSGRGHDAGRPGEMSFARIGNAFKAAGLFLWHPGRIVGELDPEGDGSRVSTSRCAMLPTSFVIMESVAGKDVPLLSDVLTAGTAPASTSTRPSAGTRQTCWPRMATFAMAHTIGDVDDDLQGAERRRAHAGRGAARPRRPGRCSCRSAARVDVEPARPGAGTCR